MTGTIYVTVFASLMYTAFTALIRFLYVSSSLKKDVQDVYRKDKFIFLFICLGEGLSIFNIVTYILQQNGKEGNIYLWEKNVDPNLWLGSERSGFLLYKACLDPFTEYSVPIFTVMTINQILLYILDMMTILFNLFLYRFLSLQTKNNTGSWFKSNLYL